ncbi:glycoside hydrolase family 3 C-terminal domain-containing protein [Actinocrinis puniceicyclus]|uniref:Glycoside hydrolase family 3 C-terminal domain-containing protein n=1 Tax=Actinocrinis puniceicyclus TaxID=977794 RepID=A0A8J7WKB0_9ACTN|nr:glycoside hydrolase family 3 C-terminal domain-containing protein [Actinocrinis puniceicyclus]MBS2963851.1 glycoside hydrolase family 3 C-terminal domain-containing protein [Actinocrinis puniceicyclus]
MDLGHTDMRNPQAARDGQGQFPARDAGPSREAGTGRELLAALSLEQKIAMLTGADNFTLPGEPGIGLRGLVMSDGPAGVRGAFLDPADRSSSLPAPIALAASWDPQLVEQVAAQLGREARAKGIDVVLGPTVNLVRTPFGGRGFECFGEDPVLAARTAAAWVRGLQSEGVAATAKHFVGNDAETERWTADSLIDETTLRELYLVPFEACVTEAECALVMAGYNKVNGATMTEHEHLLRTVLKQDWGFGGAVVSDWFAARSTEPTALAGLDLVMPGPDGPWGEQLAEAVARGAVSEAEIDEKVLRLLRVARMVGALGGEPSASRPGPHADRRVLRTAAAGSFTLLRNSTGTLPLGRDAHSIALLGPNAMFPQYQGLGSAQVGAAIAVSPAEGLRAALGQDAQLTVRQGCRTWLTTPTPEPGTLTDPATNGPGARLEIRGKDGALQHTDVLGRPEVTWWDPMPPQVVRTDIAELTFRTLFRAAAAGPHRFAVTGLGALRLELSGPFDDPSPIVVADTAPPAADPVEPLSRPFEIGTVLDLDEGDSVQVFASCDPTGHDGEFTRFQLGVVPLPQEDTLLKEAVSAAQSSDVAVVVVGAAAGTESEGYDRQTLALPGRQDELIAAVAAVNSRTVVVVNCGMPVLMPWADQVAAILQVWFPGQEFGHALADVLLGELEPGGRLPVTIPRSEAGCPVGPARPVDGALEYSEGLLVGYRAYDKGGTEPLFPFGHGLGYTSWMFEGLDVPVGPVRAGADVEVTVTVRNTGRRPGREVVQLYLSEPVDNADSDGSGTAALPERHRPVRVLAALGAAQAEPGEAVHVRLRVPGRAFARWDAQKQDWVYPRGRYLLQVGHSSRDLRLSAPVQIG